MDFSFELFAGIRLGCLPRGGLKLEDGEMSLWKEEYTRGNPIFAGVGLGCLPYGFLWWAWTSFLEDRLGVADPQINLLNSGCSQYNVSDVSNFYTNLNATFSDLRTQLNNNKYFATAQQVKGSESAYTLVQCRNYLSNADCLACFTAAVSQIRNCSAANGARVIYDGCFLRYESNIFFDQTTLPGNQGYCGNRTASQPLAFSTAADGLLKDLQVATPRINGFFAASKREVVDSSGNATVYAVAQCVETATESGCQNCLNVASNNIQACVPNGDGRAVDAGCFLRYSDKPFFADNQTTDINSFLGNGGSSNKNAIIGGVVGGGGALLITALFVFFIMIRRSKEVRRGDILGATELRGPVNYKYNDLKSATKNFCEENKLGEGGFGDVYKGTLKNGKMVAVKKLAIGQSSRAKADFENFGLARLLPEDQTHLSTKFAGTLGYTAPEYAIHGQLSEKVDTYSFGVIVLEIICGRKTSEVQHAFDGDYLLERAWKLYENNKHSELVDETLNPEEYIAEEVKKMVEIALMCTQSSASVRPSMSEVVVLLKGKGSMENRPPTKPGYVNTDRKICGDTSTSTGSSTSNATASISQRPAR
nr:cysteine-rich receptor-like protein kinase 3 [Quercus suber]